MVSIAYCIQLDAIQFILWIKLGVDAIEFILWIKLGDVLVITIRVQDHFVGYGPDCCNGYKNHIQRPFLIPQVASIVNQSYLLMTCHLLLLF